jgi:hypothetical protein
MAAALIGVVRPELRKDLLKSWRRLRQRTRTALTAILLSVLVVPAIVIVVILMSSMQLTMDSIRFWGREHGRENDVKLWEAQHGAGSAASPAEPASGTAK